MIVSIRKYTKGMLAYGIVILITIPFLLTGIGQYLQPTNKSGLTIGDVEISEAKIKSMVTDNKKRLAKIMDTTLPDVDKNIRTNVENLLIAGAYLDLFAKNNNIVAPSNSVFDQISTQEYFQIDGEFNIETYKDVLAANNISVTAYEKIINTEITNSNIKKFLERGNSVLKNDVFATSSRSKIVAIKEIVIDKKEFKQPPEEELLTLYNVMKPSLTSEKSIDVNFIEITDQMIKDRITPSFDELSKSYSDYSDSLLKAKTFNILHTISENEDDANAMLSSMQVLGVDEATSSEYYMEKVELGDLGEEVDNIMATMNESEVKVFKSDFGWHSLVVNSFNKIIPTPFEQKKPDLVEDFKLSRLSLERNNIIEDVNNIIYEGSLEEINDNYGFSIKHLTGKTVSTLGFTEAASTFIFNVDTNGRKNSIENSESVIYYSISNIVEPRQLSFNEAKDKLLEASKISWERDSINIQGLNMLGLADYTDWYKIDVSMNILNTERYNLSDLKSLVFGDLNNNPQKQGILNTQKGSFVFFDTGETKDNELFDKQLGILLGLERTSILKDSMSKTYPIIRN